MIQQYFEGTDDPVAARAEMEAAYPASGSRTRARSRQRSLLVSDESSFVNGTPILVDGGLTAKTY